MSTSSDYFEAIAAKDIAAVKRLIRSGVAVNTVSSDPAHYQRTPLHMCVWDNYVDGAKALIDAGADVNALDKLHDTPFLLSGAEGRVEILEHMFKHATAVSKSGKHGASVPDFTVRNRFGGNALIPACERGHTATVKLLIAHGIDVNHYNYYDWTGLLEAIEIGGDDKDHVEIVKMLIEAGVDVNQEDGQGCTPLYLARKNKLKRITALLEAADAKAEP